MFFIRRLNSEGNMKRQREENFDDLQNSPKRVCDGPDPASEELAPSPTKEDLAIPFTRTNWTDTVQVRVGPTQKLFRIHKDKFCAASEHFSRMFDGGKKSTNLGEDDPEAFELVVQWCYTRLLPTFDQIPEQERDAACWLRLKLYCFSERWEIATLMDYSMDFILQYLRGGGRLSPGWCIFAYESTSVGSRLRLLVARHYYYGILTSKSGRYGRSEFMLMAPRDLFQDIFTQIREQSKRVKVRQVNPAKSSTDCEYHCHTVEGITECPYKSSPVSGDLEDLPEQENDLVAQS